MAKDSDYLINDFRQVANERVASVSEAVDALRADASNESVLQDMLREFHTLKSESMMVEFQAVNSAAHKIEELLLYFKRQEPKTRSRILDLVITGVDIVAALVEMDPDSSGEGAGLTFFSERVDSVTSGATDIHGRPLRAATDQPAGSHDVAPAPAESSAGAAAADGVQVSEIADRAAEQQAPANPVAGGIDSRRAEATATDSAAAEADQSFRTVKLTEAVRIDLGRIDELTGSVGDCFTSQGTLMAKLSSLQSLTWAWRDSINDLARNRAVLAKKAGTNPQIRASLAEGQRLLKNQRHLLAATVQQLAQASDDGVTTRRIIADIESRVRRMRLVRLGTLLERYPRAARRLAKDQGKQVTARIRGEDAEVDSHVLTEVSEPLLHLVRNAIAHGIETPEERRLAGKNPVGQLVFTASQHGAHAELRIRDDGRGIDHEKIRRRAVAQGLCTVEEVSEWSREQVVGLIFRAGFSTKDRVDAISGRGIGLDVVKQRVERIGGQVHVSSEAGVGTEFRLLIPVALVLRHALLVQAGRATLGLPTETIEQITRVRQEAMQPYGARMTVEYDGDLVPVVDVWTQLAEPSMWQEEPESGRPLLIVKNGGVAAALRVDELVGHRRVLQRPMETLVRGLRIFTGTALLESGDHVPMLNTAEIFQRALHDEYAASATSLQLAHLEDAGTTTILVVDDSEFIRDVIVGILRRAGYEIVEAINGQDALEKIEHRRPDVILTDLEMPVMSGFELLAELQNREALGRIPVVVFSTRGAEADKERALELGADAYLVKRGFNEADLLAMVGRYSCGDAGTQR